MWAAVIIFVCQVIIMAMLAWFIRVFGAYTAAFIKAHDEDRIVKQQIMRALEYFEDISRKEHAA